MDGKQTTSSGLLLQLFQHEPGRIALTLVDGSHQLLHWHYCDLLRQQAAAAQWLQHYGTRAGDCIVVIAGNNPHVIALLLASIQLSCCFVPVNPDVSTPMLQTILHQLRPRLIVVEHLACSHFQQLTRLSRARLLRLRPQHAVWLRAILGRAHALSDLRETAASVPSDTLLLLYSSGATGVPKAIRYTATSLSIFLHWQRQLFAAFPDQPQNPATSRPSDRINVLPLAHFGGLSFCLQTLLEGRTMHLLTNYSAADYFALARRSRCQLLLMIPGLYELLLRADAQTHGSSELRYCLTMGEAISPGLSSAVEKQLGVGVYSAYGMSEGLSGIGHTVAALQAGIPVGSCGKLLFGEAQLRDTAGSEAPFEGELFVRNATTCPSYLDAALNDNSYRQGWYRTGDWFRRDADGYYFYQGRADELCIINGHNLYPAEVETIVGRHSRVEDCIAAPIVLADGRTRLGVLVVSAADDRPLVGDLLDFCIAHGALYTVPGWIVFGDAVPRNALGKRDRKAAAHLLQRDYTAQQQQAS